MKGKTTYGLKGITNKNIKSEKFVMKDIKFSQLYQHWTNKEIIIPDFQREQCETKIKEMEEEYIKNRKHFTCCTNPIQFGTIQIENNKFKHYIIDGQHRFQMILNLFKNNEIDDYITVTLNICKNQKEIRDIFCLLIKGQKEEYSLPLEEIEGDFNESFYWKLRNWLRESYSENFIKSSTNERIYNIDSFIKELRKRNFIDLKPIKKKFCKAKLFLMKKNKKFVKKIKYKKNIDNESEYYYKNEQKYACLKKEHPIVFSLKRSNYIDYLFTNKNNKVEPYHPVRAIKKKITKAKRKKVWYRVYKDKKTATCPISFCSEIISQTNFSCGHIKSEYNGGNTDIKNLKPLCKSCNSSMGKKNWNDFDKKL